MQVTVVGQQWWWEYRYDVDGDGTPDIVESTTVSGIDFDGDGQLSDGEIEVDGVIAVREDAEG